MKRNDAKNRWVLVACVVLALVVGSAPALADPVGGYGVVVGYDATSGELRMDDGMRLRLTTDTRILDANGRATTLDGFVASEDDEEVVRFEGDRGAGGVVTARIVEIGVQVPQ